MLYCSASSAVAAPVYLMRFGVEVTDGVRQNWAFLLQWWEEQELRELTATMGLQNFQRHRSNRFIMFAVQKPQSASH